MNIKPQTICTRVLLRHIKIFVFECIQNYSFKRIIYDGFTKNTVRIIIVIDTFDSMLNRQLLSIFFNMKSHYYNILLYQYITVPIIIRVMQVTATLCYTVKHCSAVNETSWPLKIDSFEFCACLVHLYCKVIHSIDDFTPSIT